MLSEEDAEGKSAVEILLRRLVGSARRGCSLAPLAAALFLVPAASAVDIEWVTVGDAGNACDVQKQGCFGAVAYQFRISKYEITNIEYAEFLNAVDPTGANLLGLYNSSMASSPNGGIDF